MEMYQKKKKYMVAILCMDWLYILRYDGLKWGEY